MDKKLIKKFARQKLYEKDPRNETFRELDELYDQVEGVKGDKGDRGEQGIPGKDGTNGRDGKNGLNGSNGRDGIDGKSGVDGKNGNPGRNGSPDTPEEIAEKLNTLEAVLDYTVLKNIPTLEQLAKGLKNKLDISDIRNWNQPAKGKLDQRWHGGGGLATVSHDSTLKGLGTAASPLSVVPVAAGVSSINGLTGAITLAAGTNITLSPVGNTITISAAAVGVVSPLSISGQTISLAGLTGIGSGGSVIGVNGAGSAWAAKSLVAGANITLSVTDSSITISGSGGGNNIGWNAETPSGTVDGSNTAFTMAASPANTNSVLVLLDGVTQYNGIDYTVSGQTITFTVAPQLGSTIFCYYTTLTSSGSGTVTSVSVVTANGVSGSVANPTTTPAITLTLGAITPTSVVASGAISGTTLTATAANSATLGTSGANAGAVRFRNATNGNLLTLVSGVTGSNLTFTLPIADGSGGQFLKTDGAGTLSWGSATASPGGSSTQIQFNQGGNFGGLSNVLSTDNANFTQVGIALGSDATNDMYFRNSSGLLARIASAANAVLVTDGSSVQSFSQTIPAATQANITRTGKITVYNGVATSGAGNGIATVVGYQRRNGVTNSPSGNIAGFTPGTDGSFIVSANVNVTNATNHNFTVTCSYTDETNAGRVLTLNFTLVAGTFTTTIANANGAVPYHGMPNHIRAKGGTSINFQTGGAANYTNVVYNIEAQIMQIA